MQSISQSVWAAPALSCWSCGLALLGLFAGTTITLNLRENESRHQEQQDAHRTARLYRTSTIINRLRSRAQTRFMIFHSTASATLRAKQEPILQSAHSNHFMSTQTSFERALGKLLICEGWYSVASRILYLGSCCASMPMLVV